MSVGLLRVYLDPDEIGADGYPRAWHSESMIGVRRWDPIKDLVRALAGHRCIRCRHPYVVGETPGEWSPCDSECRHRGPMQVMTTEGWAPFDPTPEACGAAVVTVGRAEAQWRILTVHHLNGVKYDCRWWNLAALCQRCHLAIQSKVVLERPFDREHSEWFKPYAAGWYAWRYLGEELTREETMARLDELLVLELIQDRLW